MGKKIYNPTFMWIGVWFLEICQSSKVRQISDIYWALWNDGHTISGWIAEHLCPLVGVGYLQKLWLDRNGGIEKVNQGLIEHWLLFVH